MARPMNTPSKQGAPFNDDMAFSRHILTLDNLKIRRYLKSAHGQEMDNSFNRTNLNLHGNHGNDHLRRSGGNHSKPG
jgi:hypothetical protein